MNETVITVLVIFGIGAVIGILIMIAYFVYEVILEFIRERQIRYIQKHRFDGPPTAKCWNKANQKCCVHSGFAGMLILEQILGIIRKSGKEVESGE